MPDSKLDAGNSKTNQTLDPSLPGPRSQQGTGDRSVVNSDGQC